LLVSHWINFCLELSVCEMNIVGQCSLHNDLRILAEFGSVFAKKALFSTVFSSMLSYLMGNFKCYEGLPSLL